MDYKYACVIDAQKLYKTFVLVLLIENEEHQQEEQIQHYEMLEGEMLVDTVPPTMRPYAGLRALSGPSGTPIPLSGRRLPMRRRLLPGKPSTLRRYSLIRCLRTPMYLILC